jgi:hypothetical protein
MPHIKPKFINAGGLTGEFSVEDMHVFPEGGKLAHVRQFWDAVVAQTLLLDQAHAVAVQDWTEATGDQNDPEFAIEASYREEVLRHSDQYLLRANIYALLLAFFEFAMLEVYKLKFGGPPAARRPRLHEDILQPLSDAGVIPADIPNEYVHGVSANRDAIGMISPTVDGRD